MGLRGGTNHSNLSECSQITQTTASHPRRAQLTLRSRAGFHPISHSTMPSLKGNAKFSFGAFTSQFCNHTQGKQPWLSARAGWNLLG